MPLASRQSADVIARIVHHPNGTDSGPADVAKAALFLVSDDSRFTGSDCLLTAVLKSNQRAGDLGYIIKSPQTKFEIARKQWDSNPQPAA